MKESLEGDLETVTATDNRAVLGILIVNIVYEMELWHWH